MIMALDREGSALLRLLIAHLSSIDHTDPSTFITYAEAHSALRLPMLGATVGISLQMQGLNSLAGWLHANGLPALSGLIVNADTRAPGKGFFSSYGKDDTDSASSPICQDPDGRALCLYSASCISSHIIKVAAPNFAAAAAKLTIVEIPYEN
jgi:hypothetical protein